MKIPTKEQIQWLASQYPVSSRVVLGAMDDPQAPPPGTKGTVRYVDAMGQIGVEWDTGSSLSLNPGKDHFHKEAPKKNHGEVSR